jgi:hypothetical protein
LGWPASGNALRVEFTSKLFRERLMAITVPHHLGRDPRGVDSRPAERASPQVMAPAFVDSKGKGIALPAAVCLNPAQ